MRQVSRRRRGRGRGQEVSTKTQSVLRRKEGRKGRRKEEGRSTKRKVRMRLSHQFYILI